MNEKSIDDELVQVDLPARSKDEIKQIALSFASPLQDRLRKAKTQELAAYDTYGTYLDFLVSIKKDWIIEGDTMSFYSRSNLDKSDRLFKDWSHSLDSSLDTLWSAVNTTVSRNSST